MRRTKPPTLILVALVLVGTSACEKLKENVPKAVVLEYDHVLSFKNYEFEKPYAIVTPTGTVHAEKIYGAAGYTGAGDPQSGVWLTFIVCKISNSAPQAESFQYQATKFYVNFAGKKQYVNTLSPYTFTYNQPGIAPQVVTPAIAAGVRQGIRDETQVGADKESVSAGQEVYPYFRFTIYVLAPTFVDLNESPKLVYDSAHPHILLPRNQPPSTLQDADKAALPTKCRPPAQ